MTIAAQPRKFQYNGNGVTTVFAYNAVFYANTDLVVTRTQISTGDDTVLTLTTDYTITGGNGTTGSVTALVAPTADQRITITSALPNTQTTDFKDNEPFRAGEIETGLDKLTVQIQEIGEHIDRAIKLKSTTTSTNPTFPEPAASQYIRWNAAATQLESVILADLTATPVSSFGASLIDDPNAAAARTTLGLGSLATLSSVALSNIVGGAGTENRVLKVDAAGAVTAGFDTYVPYGNRVLNGLNTSNNGTDSNNDIDIAAGAGADANGFVRINASSFTKRLDATFAAGTNNGGIATGAKAASTNYAVWMIYNTTTGAVDFCFDTSASGANCPSGYALVCRVAWIRTNASSNILQYVQRGDYFKYLVTDTVSQAISGNARVLTTIGPPLVRISCRVNIESPSANNFIVIGDPAETDAAPASTTTPGTQIAITSGTRWINDVTAYTDSSGRWFHRVSSAMTGTLYHHPYQWIDTRGRDA